MGIQQKLPLGIDAVASFQAKFLHPQKQRDEKFPELKPGQRLTDARVVRRALKKIKHKPTVCAVFNHEEFKDETGEYLEIWCSEEHVRVDKEGNPDLIFEGYETEQTVDSNDTDEPEIIAPEVAELEIVASEKSEEDANGFEVIEPEKEQVNNEEERNEEVVEAIEVAEEPEPEEEEVSQHEDNDEIDEEPLEENGSATALEVLSFAKSFKAKMYFTLGVLFSVLSGFIQPVIAYVFADSFTSFADGADENGVNRIAIIFAVLGVYAFVTMTLQVTFLETAAAEMTDTMKQEWFTALLRQDISYYDLMKTDGTATIISVNGSTFKRGLGKKLGDGINFGITAVGGIAFAFWCSWKLSLILLAIVPIMAVSTSLVMSLNQTKTTRANESYAKAGSIVYSSVSSIRTILSLNAVEEVVSKFEEATQEAYEGATAQSVYLGAANGLLMAVFLFAYVPLTLYGSYLMYVEVQTTGCDPSGAIEGNEQCSTTAFEVLGALLGITFGGAVLPQVTAALEAFVGAKSACYPALVAMYRKVPRKEESAKKKMKDYAKSKSLATRSTAGIYLPPYAIDSSSPDGLKPETVEGHIEFKDVSFTYPTRLESQIYNGLNFEIKPGTTTALCGPSGGGKSTIVQLLERFYDPSSGSISLDGVDLKDLNVKWLRKHIGLVSQEPKLFAMTIKDNIRAGCPDATLEEIEEAAMKANAHDFIMSFADGYETMVGDEGSQLSGGQKQRIAIARVLIMKPRIILLDEATSALDSESEVMVQEALDKLIEGGEKKQTIIVIAHRLSTIKNADTIAVISDGAVVETGKHKELIKKRGAYFDLVEAQKGSKSAESGKVVESSVPTGNDLSTVSSLAASNMDDLISFHDVGFAYPSRPEQKIFQGLEMTIRKGENLAIVGPSGQGKSTVIQLIEQFYIPDEGYLLYDNIPVTHLNVGWLRNQMSLVAQEPVLFDVSIKENIRFGLPTATQEDIEKVAKEANCHNFIMSFSAGYDTIVGSGASLQISGGQKQRIAIARALLRDPKILLLDEATSALDSTSERIVQAALDKITASKKRTVVQIAHRLSTVRNSDRIAVLNNGKVRETGTHDELMALKGHYHRLVQLQDLGDDTNRKAHAEALKATKNAESKANQSEDLEEIVADDIEIYEVSVAKSNRRKAQSLASGDEMYLVIGGIGAVFAGLMFPGWGFSFAYTIELLYLNPVFPCNETLLPPAGHNSCEEYWNSVSDSMRALSFRISYIYVALMIFTFVGNILVFYGFGTATERMNKRIRDATFKNLVRQEIAYFDVRPISGITSQLSDDAAMIHAFSGEPIRSFVMSLASVLVGIVASFIYMWPFALVALSILPLMAFGAEAEQKMFMGEDESEGDDGKTSGIIVIESLSNIRTIASLSLEGDRDTQFSNALYEEDPTPLRSNFIKGLSSGLGPLCQELSFGLLYWWGGWLITKHPRLYSSEGFLISLFAFMFSLSGLGAAFQGATDRTEALLAAGRIFNLMERKSKIDPLSTEGKKHV